MNDNSNDVSNDVSINVTINTNDINIVAETQTKVATATHGPDVACRAPEAPTEDDVDSGEVATTEIENSTH